MQTLAESLGPLEPGPAGEASLREWIARFADLYERYGPVIRAWTEAEIGSHEFGRLGTDVLARFTRVLDAAHRARPRRPTSTRRSPRSRSSRCSSGSTTTRSRARCALGATRSSTRSRGSPSAPLFGAGCRRSSGATARAPAPPSSRAWRSPSSETGPGVRDLALRQHDRVVGDARARGARAARR